MCEDLDEGQDLAYDWFRARKEHRCFACGETIRPGDKYHRSVQKYEGEVNAFKHCARCWLLIDEILKAGAESVQWDLKCGVSWQNAFGEEPPERVVELALMTPDEAQRKLADVAEG